ncbi:hypothetical protein GE300_20055 [Rhodobacteraceae bacterium 2CG4]|uniref:Uncharacterized protein n=1 Tax=Halovulum marinum TaxID=2662447 RepID=A0A6L5Z7F5_9RHOB|nr:hypothetical protein [Halovulum marinum]MSU91872.1 hypothetical protein [Halovulum marinum]
MQVLDQGTATARKEHQCYDCYRTIAKGTVYSYCKTVDMGRAATCRSHVDCHEAAMAEVRRGTAFDVYDGVPPLKDMLGDSGQFQVEVDLLRGHFPHVATRLELGEQLSEIRWQDKLRERRFASSRSTQKQGEKSSCPTTSTN